MTVTHEVAAATEGVTVEDIIASIDAEQAERTDHIVDLALGLTEPHGRR